jgi:hypothetical protein
MDSGAKQGMREQDPPVLASEYPLLLGRLEAGGREAEPFARGGNSARDARAHCNDQQSLTRVGAEPLYTPQEGALDACGRREWLAEFGVADELSSTQSGDELTEREGIAAGHLHEPVDHLSPDRVRHTFFE